MTVNESKWQCMMTLCRPRPGMLEIIMSLPVALWIYTYIFRIEYFDTICSLSVYTGLGRIVVSEIKVSNVLENQSVMK
jgi:hypothetical protein